MSEHLNNAKKPNHTGTQIQRVVKYIGFGALTAFLLFLALVISLRWVNPPFTAFTLQEDWAALNTPRYSLKDYWIDYGHIPDNIKWAVIASEDQNFWNHSGLDTDAIKKAIDEKEKGIRTRGASTITQQVAKNLFLSGSKTYFRKGIEAALAVTIELFWPKERILEVYLNIAEFGPGIFGIGKASLHFFGKQAMNLEPDEAARMAAVLPSPKRMRVEPPSPYVVERRYWILQNMKNLSGIAYYNPTADTQAEKNVENDSLFIEYNLIGRRQLEKITLGNAFINDSLDRPDTLRTEMKNGAKQDSLKTDSVTVDTLLNRLRF